MQFTPDNPLVLSSSSLAAFMRCPKSYELSYVMGLEMPRKRQVVENGIAFHKYMEMAAKGEALAADDDMGQVAAAYLQHKPLPQPDRIIGAEEQVWTRLLPNVVLRCTFDLIYVYEERVVARDYKTFEKSPTIQPEMDFQGRLYLAQLHQAPEFFEGPFAFEWEHVRQVPPGTKNSKGVWTKEECYITARLILPQHQIARVWLEAQAAARSILKLYEEGTWWRVGVKGSFPGSCNFCFVKDLCKAEMNHGSLDEQTIDLYECTRREPMTVPEGV